MKTLIIDYGAGNLRSVLNSLKHVAGTDEHVELCDDASLIKSADRVILPGVGAFHECKRGLENCAGMIDALNAFKDAGKPFMGICVGMQLLAQKGTEHGKTTEGLGWLSGEINLITPNNSDAKIPHMGWNTLEVHTPHAVLDGLSGQDVYFVHSYSAQNMKSEEIIASTDYYGNITVATGRDNIIGLQFHPEKSQTAGLKILENFLGWRP